MIKYIRFDPSNTLGVQSTNIEKIRSIAAKSDRKEFEVEEEFSVASGAAFIAALGAKTAVSVTPADLRDYICGASSISQTSGASGSLTTYHIMSRLQLFSVDVPGGETGWEGGVDYTWMRTIMPSTGLGCHQGSPLVTSTFNETLQKLASPLDLVSGNYGALVSNPAYSDFGSLTYLADVVLKSSGSWNDDAPLIRALLLADMAVNIKTIKCDPLLGQIAIDATVRDVERVKPTARPDDALCPAKFECMAVTIDTWVGLRTGVYNIPDWNVHDWSYSVAIIPIETSMTKSAAIWIYIASFLTTKLWNNRFIYKIQTNPTKGMTAAKTEDVYNFWVRPRAASVVVEGPGRAMLVLMNVTSRQSQLTVRIYGQEVPVWTPQRGGRPVSTDILPSLTRWLDLEIPSNHVVQNWLQAWRWLCEKVASGDAINRALVLAAETSRVHLAGPLYNNWVHTSPAFYSIKVYKPPPDVKAMTWVMRNWADEEETEEAEKKRIHDWVEDSLVPWISPFHIHSNLYGKFTDWNKADWLTMVRNADQSITCHEATPDMRMARAAGLLAPANAILFVDPAAVQENLSATAYMITAGTAWMQMASGVPWIRWICYDTIEQNPLLCSLIDKLLEEASANHVSMERPNDWWREKLTTVLGFSQPSYFTIMVQQTSTVTLPWWAVQYVLQKLNYVVPGDLEMRQRAVIQGVNAATATMPMVGWHAEDNKQWQALARYTSMLGVRMTNDSPSYVVNNEWTSQLLAGMGEVSLHRVMGMVAESVYRSNWFAVNIHTIVDTTCCVLPTSNTLAMLIPSEVLVVETKAGPGNTIGAQNISGVWPDPWWDWLLSGIRAAIPFMGTSLPQAALKGAASGLHAFLSEKVRPKEAAQEQKEQREQLQKVLDTAAVAAKDVWETGKQAVGQVSEALGEFTSGPSESQQ